MPVSKGSDSPNREKQMLKIVGIGIQGQTNGCNWKLSEKILEGIVKMLNDQKAHSSFYEF